MAYRIVTLGDSVPWGQGLLEQQKYDFLIEAALTPDHPEGITIERLAHSGAVAAPGNGQAAPAGEVPAPYPSILAQVDSVTSPETVDLVLLNGGINDVGVATILNPLAFVPPLAERVRTACYHSMLRVLQHASAVFTKPSARLCVTDYYPILSDRSDPLGISALLHMHGLQTPDFVDVKLFHNVVVDRCEEFFSISTDSLRRAVNDAGDSRMIFVTSGFTDENALFVPGTSFLWGLDKELEPEDPVAAPRHVQCDLTFAEPLQFAQREQCYRASAGHPNPHGAAQFARQVLAALHTDALAAGA